MHAFEFIIAIFDFMVDAVDMFDAAGDVCGDAFVCERSAELFFCFVAAVFAFFFAVNDFLDDECIVVWVCVFECEVFEF